MNTQKEDIQSAYNMPEALLISRIVAGDSDLFEVLIHRHNQTLYRVLRGYFRQDEDVLDLMQDTYLKAFEKLYQFRGDSAFSTWLIRIGVHEALHHLKQEKAKHVTRISALNFNDAIQYRLSEASQHADKKISGKEASALLEQAVDSLHEKYRIIYILKEVEGLSNSEIAAILNISPANVKVRLHRAKEMLKTELLQIIGSKAAAFAFGGSRCDSIAHRVMDCIRTGRAGIADKETGLPLPQ